MRGLWVFAAPLVLLVAVAGFLWVGSDYPADSRPMPMLVGAVMVVLLGLDLLSRSETGPGRAAMRALNPAVAGVHPRAGRSLRPVLLIVGAGAGVALVGTLVAVPAYVLVAMRLHGRHGWVSSAGAAVAVAGFVGVLFSVLLRLPLFPGLLFGGEF